MSQIDYELYAKDYLKVVFKNPELLVTALTHRSYLNEHRNSASEHNERLEFLGDAVLELVVTRFLYLNYEQPEGVLTNWRSALVRTESISEVAQELEVDGYLRLSRGEKQGSERARQQIWANAFEAIIGAIYLDQGYEAAEKFITVNLLKKLEYILKEGSWIDPKSQLQETIQSQEGFTPLYRVMTEEGPDHEKQFTVAVIINGEERGRGSGPSKQLAQQEAAKMALKAKKAVD